MKRLRRLGFALVVLTLVLGGLELAARRVKEAPATTRGIKLTSHPTRVWALAEPDPPPTYRLTADGRRASARPSPAGAPVVLTLGDSSVFGDGVPDGSTLHDALAAELGARGAPADVQTLAVPGYSTAQTLVALDEIGWALGPKLLVVANLWSDANLDSFRDDALLAAARSPQSRLEGLLTSSALFRQTRAAVNNSLGRPTSRRITWPQPGGKGVRRVPLDAYARNLEKICDDARSRGVGVVFLTLSRRIVVDVGLKGGHEWEPYFRTQTAVAQARGVPRVDATEALRADGSGTTALFHDDLHPSAQGAGVLARVVADAVLAAGWPGTVPVPTEAAPVRVGSDRFDGVSAAAERSMQREILDR